MAKDGASERISRIETLVNELLAQVRGVPLSARHRAATEGEWTAIQVLAHVTEFVPFWARQARWLSEQEQEKIRFGRSTADPEQDPERLGAIERYGNYSLSGIEGLLQKGRAQAVEDLQAIRSETWTRTGQQVNGQVRTVAQVVDELLIDHLVAHIQQVAQILEEERPD